jgi:anti-anti-sigma factor
MQVNLRREDDIVIADLSGRLVLGEAQEALRDTVEELIAAGDRKILLNVSNLARVDSSGIGELVAALKLAQSVDARLALLQLEESIRRILDMSRVLPLFENYSDESEAIAALSDEA